MLVSFLLVKLLLIGLVQSAPDILVSSENESIQVFNVFDLNEESYEPLWEKNIFSKELNYNSFLEFYNFTFFNEHSFNDDKLFIPLNDFIVVVDPSLEIGVDVSHEEISLLEENGFIDTGSLTFLFNRVCRSFSFSNIDSLWFCFEEPSISKRDLLLSCCNCIAASITYSTSCNCVANDLMARSTDGNIRIEADISGSNIYIESTKLVQTVAGIQLTADNNFDILANDGISISGSAVSAGGNITMTSEGFFFL